MKNKYLFSLFILFIFSTNSVKSQVETEPRLQQLLVGLPYGQTVNEVPISIDAYGWAVHAMYNQAYVAGVFEISTNGAVVSFVLPPLSAGNYISGADHFIGRYDIIYRLFSSALLSVDLFWNEPV